MQEIKKFSTSVTPKAEHKMADNTFLYKELSTSIIPLSLCPIALIMSVVNFNKISKSLTKFFLNTFEFDPSPSVRVSLPPLFPSAAL